MASENCKEAFVRNKSMLTLKKKMTLERTVADKTQKLKASWRVVNDISDRSQAEISPLPYDTSNTCYDSRR